MQPSNTLHIESLSNDWRDKDSVMLHACFQLLKDCIEKEDLLSTTDWSVDEKHQHTHKEIEELYSWWKSYEEDTIPNDESFQVETQMLIRLMKIRWALWT